MTSSSARRDGDERNGETVGEIVYARIRADIVFGRLSPGEKLRLEAVSQRYGISISTMREMLSRLGSEGLIVAEGQRGFEVAPVSAGEFRELAALRYLLEAHAMTRSFELGDLDWEASVVAAHHKLAVTEARMLDGTEPSPDLWKACDRAFHQALISACGSKSLMTTHSSVYDKYLRYQVIAVAFRGEVAAREHALLLDSALKRDAARAAETLRQHLDRCVDFALTEDPPAWATVKARPGADHARAVRQVAPARHPETARHRPRKTSKGAAERSPA